MSLNFVACVNLMLQNKPKNQLKTKLAADVGKFKPQLNRRTEHLAPEECPRIHLNVALY